MCAFGIFGFLSFSPSPVGSVMCCSSLFYKICLLSLVCMIEYMIFIYISGQMSVWDFVTQLQAYLTSLFVLS